MNIQLGQVTDLTRAANRRRIGTTVQELTGDWRGYRLRNPHPAIPAPYWTNVPTQRLGQALHDLPGLEGFLTYSAKVPTRQNLVVFPQKLQAGSQLRFHNPATGQVTTIP